MKPASLTRRAFSISTCALALAAVPTFAATDSSDDIATKFKKLDANNDGRISSAEYTNAPAEKKHWWNFAAKNPAPTAAHTPEMFQQLDTNRDGYLTQAELSNGELLRATGSDTYTPATNQSHDTDRGMSDHGTAAPSPQTGTPRTPNNDGADASK